MFFSTYSPFLLAPTVRICSLEWDEPRRCNGNGYGRVKPTSDTYSKFYDRPQVQTPDDCGLGRSDGDTTRVNEDHAGTLSSLASAHARSDGWITCRPAAPQLCRRARRCRKSTSIARASPHASPRKRSPARLPQSRSRCTSCPSAQNTRRGDLLSDVPHGISRSSVAVLHQVRAYLVLDHPRRHLVVGLVLLNS